ncbi:MAG: hypothetical protein JWN69_1571 [Alphaproteobacteria bacterium]|nr:hypothetical protein [Alphaproteobacteria bacterium]
MKPSGRLKMISGVRDLQIVDSEGRNCGIADEIVFERDAGGALHVKAILVGPGAYAGRLPSWAMWLVRQIAGQRMVEVPWKEVRTITSAIRLLRPSRELGLGRAEERARKLVPKGGGF